MWRLVAALAILGAGARADGAVVLHPVADTTLIQAAPANNLGAQEFFNAGSANIAGGRNRGLLRFDLSQIPAHAQITGASLVLHVVLEPAGGGPFSNFRLHRVLRSWGEGDKKPMFSPGLGVPATAGEATWTSRFYPDELWSAPGGALGEDFAEDFSAEQFIYGVGDSPYLFDSTPRMLADLQAWVQDPASNFGWALLTASEDVRRTARRFGSRETPGSEPELRIAYDLPLRLENPRLRADGVFEFEFAAEPGITYSVQATASLAAPDWQTLTVFQPPLTQPRITVAAPAEGGARFFRVLASSDAGQPNP